MTPVIAGPSGTYVCFCLTHPSPPMVHRSISLFLTLLLGLLVVCGFPSDTRAQTADDVLRFSLRSPSSSARAVGFSGGGIAGWADLSAMTTNPAGLGYYSTSEFAGGLDVLVTNNASTFQVGPEGQTFSREADESAVRLGSLAGVYKAPTEQGSLVLGIGFTQTQTFDRTLSYEGNNQSSSITDVFLPTSNEYAVDSLGVFFPDDVPSNIIPFIAFEGGAIEFFRGDYNEGRYPFEQAVLPGTPIRQEGTVQREGRMNEINFSGAAEVARNVMVGLSANLTVGSYHFSHELTEIDQGENANYEVLRDGEFYVGLDQMTFREQFESEFTGFNLRVGLSADVASNVRVGFTAETPTWTSVRDDYTDAIIHTEFLDGKSLAYGDDPNEDVGKGTFDYQITTPWRLGTGLAYDNGQLRVSADMEFIDWSNLELDSRSFDFPTENARIEDDFGVVLNWHGGIEYTVDEGPTLRGGIAYRPDPRQYDVTFANGESHDRTRTFLSLGVSYPFSEQLTLDVGWMQERTVDQFQPYPSVTPPNETASIVPPLADEDITRNQVRIGFRYSF